MSRPLAKLELPDGWQQQIIDEYAQGASDVEVKCMIHGWRGSFSNDLWDRWMRDEPAFSETIKQGRMFAEQWWLKVGRAGAVGKILVNPTLWIFNMKNRFNWHDKQIVDVTGEVQVKKIERSIVHIEPANG